MLKHTPEETEGMVEMAVMQAPRLYVKQYQKSIHKVISSYIMAMVAMEAMAAMVVTEVTDTIIGDM